MKLSDAEAIFNQALELNSMEKRTAYVQSACGQDAELRSKVERLLRAHEEAGDFLQTRTANESPLSEGPGTQIGKFKILEQIGEGGFGVVYMAEQKEPVRRRVALKIIKLGMDTKQVVARFEAERQALALMDHPNIAKILDGGVTGGPHHEPVGTDSTPSLTFLGQQEGDQGRGGMRPYHVQGANAQASDSRDPHPQPLSRPMGEGGRRPGEGSHPQPSTPNPQLSSGRPYFVMELVKGRPITKFCDEERLSTAQRLELFISVCHAIQHAHQKGVVHRDIKPTNILVSFVDGRPVPKIIDFGIAKAMQHDLTDKTVFTRFHQFMGTPAYMSPEQAGTDSADIDTRSDIYSLGAVLYELLTGRTPMDSREIASADYDEIRRRIREVEPMKPSKRVESELGLRVESAATRTDKKALNSQLRSLSTLLRGDLDWVVLKAMEKDRNRRYETANEFAKDIQRYLANEPVSARKPSVCYVMQKFARRHKVALATAACFVLLLTVSACVSTAQAIKNKSLFTAAEEARLKEMSAKEREKELRRIAETERGQAEAERDRSQRLLYTAHMNLAKRAWDDGAVRRMVELLDQHRPKPGQQDMRNFEWFYLERLRHSDLLTLEGRAGAAASVAVSPDGKRLASASTNKTVKVWDAATGQVILTLAGHTDGVTSVAFSPDGKRLASASYDHTVKVWDTASGQETSTLKGHSQGVNSVAFSPDGKRLASASFDTTVKVWDPATAQGILTLKGHAGGVSSVAFSPDGKRLASGEYEGVVKVWDATNGEALLTWKADPYELYCVAFSPDGKRLASAGHDETVNVWDAATGKKTLTLSGYFAPAWSVAFSPDGKRLALASFDQSVKVWDLSGGQAGAASGQAIYSLKGHTRWVERVAFFPDGKRLASADYYGTVKVWDLNAVATGGPEAITWKGHSNIVRGVAFSPDGKRLASASWDKTVKVWDIATGQDRLTLQGHTDLVWSVAFSPDGKRLASASYDHTVKVWDTASGQETLTLKGHTRWVRDVAFSPDGKRLASASFDRTVKVWDTMSGQETLTLKGHTGGVYSVVFSPDGKRLASAGMRGAVKVWDAASGQEMLTLVGHSDEHINHVFGLAFSPDGKQLAAAGQDQTVKVWDMATNQEAQTLKGHANVVWSVAFSPDGKRLASSGEDQTVRVWDVTSGEETLTLKAGSGRVAGVAFSPDGTRLASAHHDQTVRIWDARPRSEARTP